MDNLRGWELVVILVLLVVLFGAKRLPDASRSLARSLRIFKAETKGLRDGETPEKTSEAAPPAPAAQPEPRPIENTGGTGEPVIHQKAPEAEPRDR
ncbi:MAG: sec-independent protein translocase protein TatA [Actinomycetota bacterium]|jgi:sec-independent protein translocase protein TatA|nr:sec-independent protein translocase protein TatA [Actinomycetota bacterium]